MTTETGKTALGESIIARHEALQQTKTVFEPMWQEIANYVMPRKAFITSRTTSPDTSKSDQLFDSTAIQSNQILAAGRLAWMTPKDDRWFSFDPPEEFQKNEKVKRFFARATEIAELLMAQSSNFYTETHEDDLDSGCFGTSCLYLEEGVSRLLNFDSLDVGTFAIAENAEGLVDTVARCIRMTVRQVVQKFGEKNVSEDLRKRYADEKKRNEEVEIIHWTAPREEYDRSKNDGPNKPVASCYVERATKHVLREGGYHEHPFATSRFLKWGDYPYGWSPSVWALPESRQLNFLVKMMDVLAEVQAFPRMLFPSNHEGTIDVRAHGVTYWDAAQAIGKPEEWLTGGRYDVGKDREEYKRKAIQDAFFVPLFRMLEQFPPGKEFTATEILERKAEKIDQFSPTFARSTQEKLEPILRRVWGICMRSGRFTREMEIPRELIQEGPFGYYIPDPKISFSSRIALAVKERRMTSFIRVMNTLTPLAEIVGPQIFDPIKFRTITPDIMRIEGFPSDWFHSEEEITDIERARAEAQMREQQMQEAERMAKITKDAGSVSPESVVGQQVQEQAA